MEKRYQDKENEFLAFKETQMSKPEVKMEAELSLLRVEKVKPYFVIYNRMNKVNVTYQFISYTEHQLKSSRQCLFYFTAQTFNC